MLVRVLTKWVPLTNGQPGGGWIVDVNRLRAVAPPFNTTSPLSIPAGVQIVTPASMTGIGVRSRIIVDAGIGGEIVIATAVTATTFTASFTKAHLVTPVALFAWDHIEDVTRQPTASIPPTPNLVVAEVVTHPGLLAAIVADANHGANSVLHNEVTATGVPTAPQLAALGTYLQSEGVTAAQWTALSNAATTNNWTRRQIIVALITWLQSRPHA